MDAPLLGSGLHLLLLSAAHTFPRLLSQGSELEDLTLAGKRFHPSAHSQLARTHCVTPNFRLCQVPGEGYPSAAPWTRRYRPVCCPEVSARV